MPSDSSDEWRQGKRGSRACRALRCRGWFYAQKHALWSESQISLICHLNSIRLRHCTALLFGGGFQWDLGCEGDEGQDGVEHLFERNPGRVAARFDLASADWTLIP